MRKHLSLQNSLLAITLFLCATFYIKYGHKSYPFYGDALGYYLYLPSTFIHKNLKNIESLPLNRGIDGSIFAYTNNIPFLNPKSPIGHYVNQYTYGVALMELPFFAIAHFYEKVKGLPANGYSATYAFLVKISTIFYSLLGLFFTYQILRFYTKSQHASLTTCVILLASNLFWFTFYQAGMSHVPLFFLYAVLIYMTIKVHQRANWFNFIIIGLVVGIITIMRPTDILCICIPLLYNVYNKSSLIVKKNFIMTNIRKILSAALCFFLVMLPQLLYWKMTTGTFIYYSYGTQTFNWLNPQIFKGLFSASNGWLIYSPIFFLAFLGLFYWKHFKSMVVAYTFLLPIYIYVIYCWFCYNYINGFGSRPMLHLYALLAIPIAVLIHNEFKSHIVRKSLLLLFLLFCVGVNISQSGQQARGDLLSEESNYRFNFQTLFKSHLNYDDLLALDLQASQPKEKLQLVSKLAAVNYSDSIDAPVDSFLVKHVNVGKNEYPSFSINIPFRESAFKDAIYLKCNGLFKNPLGFYDWYHNHLLVLSITRADKSILWKAIKINNKVGIESNTMDIHLQKYRENIWGQTPFFVRIPKGLQENDRISLVIWNIGKQELGVNSLSLELYK